MTTAIDTETTKGGISDLAAAHGTNRSQARRLVCEGFLVTAAVAALPTRRRSFTMLAGETVDAFAARLLAEHPAIDESNIDEFADALRATGRAKDARLSYDRLDQAAAVVALPGVWEAHAVAEALWSRLGGDRHHLTTYARDRAARTFAMTTSRKVVAAELGTCSERIGAMIALGILREDRLNHRKCVYDAQPGSLRETLLERLRALRPSEIGVSFYKHYASTREGLGLDPDAPHTEAVLDATINFLVSHGHEPTVGSVHDLVVGSRAQIRADLMRRHRAGDERVPFPPAPNSGPVTHTLAQLRAAAPPVLATVPGWALHPTGSTKTAPSSADISTCIAIADPTWATIAMVVALQGRLSKADKSATSRAITCLRRLAPQLAGMDQRSPSAASATLRAIKVVADGCSEDERWLLLQAIAGYAGVVAIYDKALLRKDLPAEAREALQALAPVLPADGETLFRAVNGQSFAITVKRYNQRMDDLDELLQSVRSFLPRLVRRRQHTQALRAHVRATAEAASAGGPDPAALTAEAVFTETPETLGDHPRARSITYRVHGWQRVQKLLGRRAPTTDRCPNKYPWEHVNEAWRAELFENRFALEIVSCLHADGTEAPPPAWFDLHFDRVFWSPRNCKDEEYALRSATMRRLHVGEYFREARASRLGEYEGKLATIARKARQHLGMRLIPLEEHNHAEAFGLYHVSMRLDEPLRTDEFLQLNVTGDNAVHDVDENGEARLGALKATPKGYTQQREFTPSAHTERFADDLLDVTNLRCYGCAGVPEVLRQGWKEGKGPRKAAFLVAYGTRTLSDKQLTTATMALLVGIHRLRPHNLKYLWNRLAKLDGKSIDYRQERQQHVRPATTAAYNPQTQADRAEVRKGKLAVNDERGRLATALQEDGGAATVVAEAAALDFERCRLTALRAGYQRRGHAPAVARCDEQLAALGQQAGASFPQTTGEAEA